MDEATLGMHDPLPQSNDRRDKRHEGHERGGWEMSATVLPKASVEETSMLAGETHLATRAADFEEFSASWSRNPAGPWRRATLTGAPSCRDT
jgi:hypothetical protein